MAVLCGDYEMTTKLAKQMFTMKGVAIALLLLQMLEEEEVIPQIVLQSHVPAKKTRFIRGNTVKELG